MKILLIHPPVPLSYYNREFYPPSGLMYLASSLIKNGDDVAILDLRTLQNNGEPRNPAEFRKHYGNIIIERASSFKPDIFGLGCLYSGQFPDVLAFSETIKLRFPSAPVVAGGIHPTIYPKEIISECPSIDYLILGEGEESFRDLVNALKAGRPGDIEKIDGCAYRKDGRGAVNPKTRFIDDLDALAFPAYDLIDIRDYYVDTSAWLNPKNLPIKTSLPIITSRSCPNRCPFCSMYKAMGPRWRARTPTNVVDEIEYLYKKYDHRHFSFMDDNMTFKKSHMMEICRQILSRGMDIEFETPNGLAINSLDEELLDAMVSAGLTRISLAIESGSDYIRNEVMKKNLSREKIFEIIRLTGKHRHLYVRVFFVIGMPEESRQSLDETYEMIKEIDADRVYIHNLVPFPGTRVFEQAVRDNLLIDVDTTAMYRSDALFITNFDRFFIKPYGLTVDELRDFRKRCDALLIGRVKK